MQPCSALNPAGSALAGGAGVVDAAPPDPFDGAGGAVVVVVVVGGTVVVVVVVVVVGGSIVVVVEGTVGVGATAGPEAGNVVVVVVGAADATGGGAVVVVVVVTVVAVVSVVDEPWPPGAGDPIGVDVSAMAVQAPAVCMVATSVTSLASERVCAAPSHASFVIAAATALDVSCTWSRAVWYAAKAA
jgi:hypothetical protein